MAIIIGGIAISYAGGASRPPERKREALDLGALDRSFDVARSAAPGWKSISVRLPLSTSTTVSIDEGNGARPDKRSQLMLDPGTGRVLERKTYAQQQPAQKARAWLRWIHTGEVAGIAGQLVAMIASAFAVMLVYTGLALALRRFARLGGLKPALLSEEGNA